MGIAYQLTLILGLDTIIETYFSGTGTKLMEDGLNSLSGESNNSKELLKQIEMTYMSKDGDFETNSLYETQRILLDYLSEKLKKINNEEEKEAIINLYSTSLITTDKLKKIVSNSEMYTDIDKNEKQFNKIINQYQNQKTDKTKKVTFYEKIKAYVMSHLVEVITVTIFIIILIITIVLSIKSAIKSRRLEWEKN